MKIPVTLFVGLLAAAFADYAPYAGEKTIRIEDQGWKLVHHHNWSNRHGGEESPAAIFTEANRSGYIELWRPSKENAEWRIPSPAFSDLWLSPDHEFIVGLSKIRTANPYQLVVFSAAGEVLKSERVSALYSRFSKEDINGFWQKFPKLQKPLMGHTRESEGLFFVDLSILDRKTLGQEAWSILYAGRVTNPFYPNVSQSTHNWIYWYADDPRPGIVRDANKICLLVDGIGDQEGLPRPRLKIEITDLDRIETKSEKPTP